MEVVLQVVKKDNRVTRRKLKDHEQVGDTSIAEMFEETYEPYDRVLFSRTVEVNEDHCQYSLQSNVKQRLSEFLNDISNLVSGAVSENEVKTQAEITRGLMKNICQEVLKKIQQYKAAISLAKKKGKGRKKK